MEFEVLPSLPHGSTFLDKMAPLEVIHFPSDLDGGDGSSRATGNKPQISAQCDLDAIKAWLQRVADKEATLASYRKEAERLLLWSTHQLGKPLLSLVHEDIMPYQPFVLDPQPSALWVMVRPKAC